MKPKTANPNTATPKTDPPKTEENQKLKPKTLKKPKTKLNARINKSINMEGAIQGTDTSHG